MEEVNKHLIPSRNLYESLEQQSKDLEALTHKMVTSTDEVGSAAGTWKKQVTDIHGSLNWLDSRYGNAGETLSATAETAILDESDSEAESLTAIPYARYLRRRTHALCGGECW